MSRHFKFQHKAKLLLDFGKCFLTWLEYLRKVQMGKNYRYLIPY